MGRALVSRRGGGASAPYAYKEGIYQVKLVGDTSSTVYQNAAIYNNISAHPGTGKITGVGYIKTLVSLGGLKEDNVNPLTGKYFTCEGASSFWQIIGGYKNWADVYLVNTLRATPEFIHQRIVLSDQEPGYPTITAAGNVARLNVT